MAFVAFSVAAPATAAPVAPTTSPSMTNLQLDSATNTNLNVITVTVPTAGVTNSFLNAQIFFNGAEWTGLAQGQSVRESATFNTTSTPAPCGSSQVKIGTGTATTGGWCTISTQQSRAAADFEGGNSFTGNVTFEIPAGALTFLGQAPSVGYSLAVSYNGSGTDATTIPITLQGLTPAPAPAPVAPAATEAAPAVLANTGIVEAVPAGLAVSGLLVILGAVLIIVRRVRA